MPIYQIFNGPMPTTASQVAVTTGTAIKTLLQVKGVTAATLKILEWGISFDGSAAATPIECELLETGLIFATVTASVAADVTALDPEALLVASGTYFAFGTTSTGYTSTGEGTITAVRMFDCQLVAPTNQYVKQFPLGREPVINAVSSARIRVKAAAAVNAICYLTIQA